MNKDLIAWNQALKEGFEAGIEAEHQRIIKLLEESDSACADWAIALIKGKAE